MYLHAELVGLFWKAVYIFIGFLMFVFLGIILGLLRGLTLRQLFQEFGIIDLMKNWFRLK